MTITFSAGPDPKTHALIVGVNTYTHLAMTPAELPTSPLGLGQLTSPVPSALAFYDWLARNAGTLRAELGSVELLLSGAPSVQVQGQPVAVAAPTRTNLELAFTRWFAACEQDVNNIAVVYLAGHGVMRERRLFLLEDFAANKNQLFQNALDFNLFYEGMARCQAQSQCYFLDACSDVPDELLQLAGTNALTLIDAVLTGRRKRDAPVSCAAGPELSAFARQNTVSLFTTALLEALGGGGARKLAGRWVITTGSLQQAIVEIVHYQMQGRPIPQQSPSKTGESDGLSVLVHPPGAPPVRVIIGVDPRTAEAQATLEIKSQRNPAVSWERKQQIGDWVHEVPADLYKVKATFPPGGFLEAEDDLLAIPPTETLRLRVSP
jgi:hypothetical protein